MDLTFTHCAGLDVHKKTVVACCLTPGARGTTLSETRTFGTMTADLLALAAWLATKEITHVAMESTGEFWKPVYNLLEASFAVWVVNAQHIKNVPGRKTDVQDAAWIAELLRFGLVRPSFIPPLPQRDLRDLTRERTNLARDRARVTSRLHKVLEWANLKLAAVATDITGVSARAMLAGIIAGETDGAVLAQLAKARMRTKLAALEQALTGRVRDHHRFLLTQHLAQLDFLEEQIAVYDEQIQAYMAAQGGLPAPAAAVTPAEIPPNSVPAADTPLSWDAATALLDTIPGVGRDTAELLVAEIGTDMSRFPSAAHLASWGKLCPGNHESAGKRFSGRTGHGNRWLRSGLVQAAHAAVKNGQSHLGRVFRRLVARHGVKKAILAIAHRILCAAYYMLRNQEPYREPIEENSEQHQARAQQRLIRQGEKLGYQVVLTPKLAGA
jgi:transposase